MTKDEHIGKLHEALEGTKVALGEAVKILHKDFPSLADHVLAPYIARADEALAISSSAAPPLPGEEWRPLSEAPKEQGKDIRVRYLCETNAFWDGELQRFVISRGPINVESLPATDRYHYRSQAALGAKP